MNDIKTSERARLGQRNLAALMFWHYHGHKLKAWLGSVGSFQPVEEILKEFRAHWLQTGLRGKLSNSLT